MKPKSLCAVLCVAAAPGLLSPDGFARATAPGELRLPDRSISVAAPKFSASQAPGLGRAVLDVKVDSVGPGSIAVARSDFKLSAEGDMFGVHKWNAGRFRIKLGPGHSRRLRLTFAVPSAVMKAGVLSYGPADGGARGVLSLKRAPAFAASATSAASTQPTIKTFWITHGVGNPWGSEIDSAGNIWFAEPGCDFAPFCAEDTPPGQIVKLDPTTGAFTYYALPNRPGNQPIFVAFDGSGNLWFTTPNNSMIGKFNPSTGEFGQWPVTPGSGPWDLTFANGQLWYTEHFVSAVGRFNPTTHVHQDIQTPTAHSNPYGIAASGALVWFTENSPSVAQVAVLDTQNNAISEYPIVPPPGTTPHLIVVGANGHPWWTEGWSNTIATLDPAAATSGSCGSPSGSCNGLQRFTVPASSTCGGSTHTSGIAYEAATDRVWFDNSLTAQVGSFSPSTGTFAMTTLSDCNAHPHDGLSLDSAGNVWFGEEFANAIGELVQSVGSPPAISSNPAAGLSPAAGLPPANTSAPTLGGTPRQAETLTALNGSWTNGPTTFSYMWQRCHQSCANIPLATSGSYELGARDIDANVRVIVTASNAQGSAQASSRSLGPVGPSLRRVRRSLSRLLDASTNGWTIPRLLRRDGFRRAFGAPSRGTLRIAWHARRVLVATAHRRFANGGTANVTTRLTRAGKRVFGRANKLTIAVQAVFIPTRQPAVTRQKRFAVSGP
jgi:streptogramin lyase